jgi:hypothetical protein
MDQRTEREAGSAMLRVSTGAASRALARLGRLPAEGRVGTRGDPALRELRSGVANVSQEHFSRCQRERLVGRVEHLRRV